MSDKSASTHRDGPLRVGHHDVRRDVAVRGSRAPLANYTHKRAGQGMRGNLRS
jgi:cytochrome c1